MIKKKITITYKDDTKETFEAIESYVMNGFYRICLSHEKTFEIPVENIFRIKTQEIWKRPKKC